MTEAKNTYPDFPRGTCTTCMLDNRPLHPETMQCPACWFEDCERRGETQEQALQNLLALLDPKVALQGVAEAVVHAALQTPRARQADADYAESLRARNARSN